MMLFTYTFLNAMTFADLVGRRAVFMTIGVFALPRSARWASAAGQDGA
jgi:hypothetical protein